MKKDKSPIIYWLFVSGLMFIFALIMIFSPNRSIPIVIFYLAMGVMNGLNAYIRYKDYKSDNY